MKKLGNSWGYCMFDKRLHNPRRATSILVFGTIFLLTALLFLLLFPRSDRIDWQQLTPSPTATLWLRLSLVPTLTHTPPPTAGWWGDSAATFTAATPLFATPKP